MSPAAAAGDYRQKRTWNLIRAMAGDKHAIEALGPELVARFRAEGARLTEEIGAIVEWFTNLENADSSS